MKTQLTSKLPNVGTTIFTVMSQLASDTGAINLSQGFPSFSPPLIVFDPAYDSYEPAITLAGGVTRHNALLIDDNTLQSAAEKLSAL